MIPRTTPPAKPSAPAALRPTFTARTVAEWCVLLIECGVAKNTAARWAPVFFDQVREGTFSKGDQDLAAFLPNILHESSRLERLEENLNYSAQGLLATFGLSRITTAQANKFGRRDDIRQSADPRAIANIVYGGAFGRRQLGNTEADDGWKYRGRTPIQITGKSNYLLMSRTLGHDFIAFPGDLALPQHALKAAILWWEGHVPDVLLGSTSLVRARVNGGGIGLAEVKVLTDIVTARLSLPLPANAGTRLA